MAYNNKFDQYPRRDQWKQNPYDIEEDSVWSNVEIEYLKHQRKLKEEEQKKIQEQIRKDKERSDLIANMKSSIPAIVQLEVRQKTIQEELLCALKFEIYSNGLLEMM